MINPWDENNYKVEEGKYIFLIPQPEQYDKRGLEIELKILTSEYIAWNIANKHYEAMNSLTKEKRNEVYKTFHKGGITIGEVAKLFNITPDLVSDIILFNLDRLYLPRGEAQ